MSVSFQTATLPNGLRLVAETDPEAHTSACGFFVRTGARDEESALMGVSHFLEHMMFKGTESLSADDVNRRFDQMGANYNAFTTHELTAFHAHVLPEYFGQGLELLAHILRPALRQEDFDSEKNVILEEIAMYEDVPFWRLYDRVMERYYMTHPLAHQVLGTKASVGSLTRDQMRTYFESRYSADNTILSITGNVDFARAVDEASRLCGGWQTTRPVRQHRPRPEVADDFMLDDEKANQHYFLSVAPAPSSQDRMRYAAEMLAHLVGDSEGSLLYWALIDTGLAESAQVGYDARDGLGEYYAFAACTTENAGRVESILRDILHTGLQRVTPDDLARVRSKIATAVTLAGERPAGRMRRLGRHFCYHADYLTLEDELARIEAVRMEDLHALVSLYPLSPRVIGRLRPVAPARTVR